MGDALAIEYNYKQGKRAKKNCFIHIFMRSGTAYLQHDERVRRLLTPQPISDPRSSPSSRPTRLDARRCSSPRSVFLSSLQGLRTLNISGCTQRTFSDACFQNLRALKHLTISDCPQFGDACFERLPVSLTTLVISGCKQTTITDRGIRHLLSERKNLTSLNMAYCNQPTITDKGFEAPLGPQITELNISRCTQKEITARTLANLDGKVKVLKTVGLEHVWRELDMAQCAQHLRDEVELLPVDGETQSSLS